MNKDTLIKVKKEVLDLLLKLDIDEIDRIELVINLNTLFENYDRDIAVLRKANKYYD